MNFIADRNRFLRGRRDNINMRKIIFDDTDICFTGQRNAPFWCGEDRDAKFDLLDLKGMLDEFLERFGLRGFSLTRRAESTPLFLESATIQLGKLVLGEIGLLLPTLAKKYDLRDPVLLAELNLDQLLMRRNPTKGLTCHFILLRGRTGRGRRLLPGG